MFHIYDPHIWSRCGNFIAKFSTVTLKYTDIEEAITELPAYREALGEVVSPVPSNKKTNGKQQTPDMSEIVCLLSDSDVEEDGNQEEGEEEESYTEEENEECENVDSV